MLSEASEPPFIGRSRELGELALLLHHSRLVTLGGTGGVGKTRLAQEVVRRQRPRTLVAFTPLEGLSRGDSVFPAIARALRLDARGPLDAARLVVAALRDADTLLILDGCEHVAGACANAAAELLDRTRAVRILSTSREPLGIPVETYFLLDPLSPDDAIALFLARAATPTPGAIHRLERHELQRIVAQVDCLPLGVELAAAALRSHSTAGIVRTLPAGGRGRHETLAAVVAWSYAQLSDEERIAFRRLGVFAAGWTLAQAQQVIGAQPLAPADIPELLRSLVRRSLVLADSETGRYRFLETTGAYSRSLFLPSDGHDIVADRHVHCFRDVAETLEARSFVLSQSQITAALLPDLPNCAAALAWAFNGGDVHDGARLLAALVPLVVYEHLLPEVEQWLEHAGGAAAGDRALHGRLLHARAVHAMFANDPRTALTHARAAVAELRETSDGPHLARALGVLARLLYFAGQLSEAVDRAREALALPCIAAMPRVRLSVLGNLDVHLRGLGNRAAASECRALARRLAAEIEDDQLLGALTGNESVACFEEGDYDRAAVLGRTALGIAARIDDRKLLAWQLMNMGSIEIRRGNLSVALEALQQGLPMMLEAEHEEATTSALLHLAEIALGVGDSDAAIRLAAAADAVRGDLFTLQPNMAEVHARLREALRGQADDLRWRAEVAAAPRSAPAILALVAEAFPAPTAHTAE